MPLRTQTIALRILAILMFSLGVTVWKLPEFRQPQRALKVTVPQAHSDFNFSLGPNTLDHSSFGPGNEYLLSDQWWIDLAFSWKQLPTPVRQSWLKWAGKGQSSPIENGRRHLFKLLAWSDFTSTERLLISDAPAFQAIEHPPYVEPQIYGCGDAMRFSNNIHLNQGLIYSSLLVLVLAIFSYHLYLRRVQTIFNARFPNGG